MDKTGQCADLGLTRELHAHRGIGFDALTTNSLSEWDGAVDNASVDHRLNTSIRINPITAQRLGWKIQGVPAACSDHSPSLAGDIKAA